MRSALDFAQEAAWRTSLRSPLVESDAPHLGRAASVSRSPRLSQLKDAGLMAKVLARSSSVPTPLARRNVDIASVPMTQESEAGQRTRSPSTASASPLAQRLRVCFTASPTRTRKFNQTQAWDWRHQKNTNEVMYPAQRSYFTRPCSSLDADLERPKSRQQVDEELSSMGWSQRSCITPDVSTQICAARHTLSGDMRAIGGSSMPWNNRWHTGIHQINEKLHPKHRDYFDERSVFERSPSQEWRRLHHIEVAHGVQLPFVEPEDSVTNKEHLKRGTNSTKRNIFSQSLVG